MMDKLICRLEEGTLYFEASEGDWLTENGEDYLTSAFEEEVRPGLEMEIEELPVDGVYLITIDEPCWVSDGGYWDMNYGYVGPETHLEWNGQVDIRKLEEGEQ